MQKKNIEPKNSVAIGFRWKRSVYEMVKADAEMQGLSIGSYLSMLASMKHLERQSMRLLSSIPDDKLRQVIEDQLRGDG